MAKMLENAGFLLFCSSIHVTLSRHSKENFLFLFFRKKYFFVFPKKKLKKNKKKKKKIYYMILSKFGWKMGKIKNFSIPPSIKTCMKFMLCIDFNIWSASQHLTTHLECLGTRYAILILVLFSMILALFSNFSFFSFFLKFSRRKKIFFSFSRKKKLRKIWNV